MAVTDLTGTTWVLNDTIDISSFDTYGTYKNFNFTSNSNSYIGMSTDLKPNGLHYMTGYSQGDSAYVSSTNSWVNEAFRILAITGGTDATNATLISWFEANATLQTPTVVSKSVDLTTLSGWANLAEGEHFISVIAKAEGYADSDPSEAVSVTKAKPVYKATVTGLGNSSPTSQTYTVDSGFPTTFEEVTKDGDIFIKIPTMYRKVNTVVSNQITSFTIATGKIDDTYLPYPCFVRPDGSVMDYILIGKYMISSSSTANSVNATNVTLTPANGLALCKAKGAGYYAYDVWTQKLFQDLELVIGKKVNYNSGTTITVSKIGINHLNQYLWVFGIIGSTGSWYVCYDTDKYQALSSTSDSIPSDYVKVGYAQPTTSSAEIQKLGYDTKNPFCNYPTAIASNGNYNTYYCDVFYYSSGKRPVLSLVGSSLAQYGLWSCITTRDWSVALGVRLCYRPLQEGVTKTNYITDSDGNILQYSDGNNLQFKEA